MKHRPTLLYSGGCRFCRWSVRHIILNLDRFHQLDIIPFRNTHANRFLHHIPEEQRYLNWWFVDRKGKLWAGNHGGGVALLRTLRLTKPLGNLFHWGKAHRFLDRLDNWVKSMRPVFSSWVNDGEAPMKVAGEHRFTLVVDFHDVPEKRLAMLAKAIETMTHGTVKRATVQPLGYGGESIEVLK